MLRALATALLCLLLLAAAAGPAAAEDCFVKVRVADIHPAAPPHAARPRPRPWAPIVAGVPHLHPVRHLVRPHARKPVKPRPVATAVPAAAPAPHRQYVEASLARRSVPVYELRPTACDVHPATQSIAPRAPATPQKLLDALAGPQPTPAVPTEEVPATLVPPIPLVTLPETPTPPDTPGFPGFPGFPAPGPGPGPVGGFPGGQPPPVGPPVVTPPVVSPPVVTPPEQPPVVPPDQPPGQPPIEPPPVIPPITPPDGPPGGPPGGPPPGVPEPATWAMLMLGFCALGASLRLRRGSLSAAARDASSNQ